MADQTKKDAAQQQFSRLQRAEDGKKAMAEYESEAVAIRAKTARLKALRLAREVQAPVAAPAAPAKKKAARKPAAQKGNLADWLAAQEGSGRNR